MPSLVPLCTRALLTMLYVGLSMLIWVNCFSLSYLRDDRSPTGEFNWSSISPSNELTYHSCLSTFKCARLLMPLDWQADQKSQSENTIAIAIIKLPAQVSPTDHTYMGPIVVNPGGPGASGIDFLQATGHFLQSVVDSHSASFDIISFDPRGVVRSEPSSDCFSTGLDSASWYLKSLVSDTLSSSESDIRVPWARAKALGHYCSRAGVGEYLSTAFVARDLLHLIEKEWSLRKKHTAQLLTQSQGTNKGQFTKSNFQVHDGDGKNPMLQYLGFSYGTFLGATFATMFPDRVRSMVLDGVLDAGSYIADGGFSNLQDTEKVMQKFYRYCHKAGLECPLYQPEGSRAIQRDVENLLMEIEKEPTIVVDEEGHLPPEILTSKEIKRWMFNSLYLPSTGFPIIASLLSVIQQRQTKQLLPLLLARKSIHCPPANESRQPLSHNEAQQAIICSDSNDTTNQTIHQLQSYISRLEAQSPLAGAILAEQRLPCTAWTARSKWRFEGPFASESTPPILWLGNKLDPITPIANAYRMSVRYIASGVVEQDAAGHCALFNGPSQCTVNAVKQYFATAKLSKKLLRCPGAKQKCEYDKMKGEQSADYGLRQLSRQFLFGGGDAEHYV